MNYNDHLPPHFHVWYGDFKAIIGINDGIVKGEMTARALKMVLKLLEDHKDELLVNWELAQSGVQLRKILPLV